MELTKRQFEVAVQYLEGGPETAAVSPDAARRKLRAAAERLPVSMVLLGWNLPEPLRDACADEARRIGARLYRWHPLLTGDGVFVPRLEWRVVSLSGDLVRGYRDLPEFTFVCPNRSAVRDAVLEHLENCLAGGVYDGVFLDRIRYPSPLSDPPACLGCFCEECGRAAERAGLDLSSARDQIRALLQTPASFMRALFQNGEDKLAPYLRFRANSITRIVEHAADLARRADLAIGLDCFSPVLTRAVAQEIASLDRHCDWIKFMTYGHTLAPAGLPFELNAAVNWLVRQGLVQEQAVKCLDDATSIRVPGRRGIPPEALGAEITSARQRGARTVFAGIELVAIPGVTDLDPEQIRVDASEFRRAADGLVLSWDLWHIPLESLELLSI